MIDGEPKVIADHWAGLTSVALAYYRDGKTYVFEKPDASGMMRHLVYTGDEGAYTAPDPGYPLLTDETFWKAPDGFPMPDAVLFEGDTMVLLSGERCVQFSEPTGLWSYPRPIERVWRGFSVATGDRLKSAFTGADGATYFFFTETFTRYADRAFAAPAEIRSRWGRSESPFGDRVGRRGGLRRAHVRVRRVSVRPLHRRRIPLHRPWLPEADLRRAAPRDRVRRAARGVRGRRAGDTDRHGGGGQRADRPPGRRGHRVRGVGRR